MREGGTGVRVSGLAHAQESSNRNFKPRVAQPPPGQEGFTAGPSCSGVQASGREHRGVDDDVDNDDDEFEDRDSIAGAPVCKFCAAYGLYLQSFSAFQAGYCGYRSTTLRV